MKPQKEPLHLLILVNSLFEWSQNFITRELTELNEQGTKMLIGARKIAQRDDLSDKERKLMQKVIFLPENPFLPGYLLRHIKTAYQRPRQYFKAWNALFFLKHKRLSKFFRSVVCLFRAAALAEVVLSKKINLIHAHFLTAPGDTALFLSKLTGIPYGATGHAMDIYRDNSGLAGKIASAAYITTCTAANERYLKTSGLADPSKIFIVYHGIETPKTLPSKRLPLQPFTFLAVGRLVAKKGFRHLLEACSLLARKGHNFRCRIIGTGPLEMELNEQMLALELNDIVTLEGYIPPNKMEEVYHRSDILVMPSVIEFDGDRDGLPNVCLEAMSYGLPVIGSRVSGIPEVVEHGKNGWLVAPGEAEDLARMMEHVINSPDLELIKIAARRRVLENFSIEKNSRDLRAVMEPHYE